MLSFEEKLQLFTSFPELEQRNVSLGRVNFHFEDSAYDKKIVVYHLHPNGNGFVYAGNLKGIAKDDRGFVNIKDHSLEDLRALVESSIQSLSASRTSKPSLDTRNQEEQWNNEEQELLTVRFEDDLWYIYAGSNLESACETYEEVETYMLEEGFTKI